MWATLWWGQRWGNEKEVYSYLSMCGIPDRYGCNLTKFLFYRHHEQCGIFAQAELKVLGLALGRMVKLLNSTKCNIRVFTRATEGVGAPVLTVSQGWQASCTEGFRTPVWNREFSEVDCQFAKGGRASGVPGGGCTQGWVQEMCLFLQLMVVDAHLENGGSARLAR